MNHLLSQSVVLCIEHSKLSHRLKPQVLENTEVCVSTYFDKTKQKYIKQTKSNFSNNRLNNLHPVFFPLYIYSMLLHRCSCQVAAQNQTAQETDDIRLCLVFIAVFS